MKKETLEEKRRRILNEAKASVSNAYKSEEHALIQAISAYLETEKLVNLMYERLSEWYGIYFPELKLTDANAYSSFVLRFGSNKKAARQEDVTQAMGEKSDELFRQMQSSIGREPSEGEYTSIKEFAETEQSLLKLQKNLDSYIEKGAKAIMPNISYLVEPRIAAELLAKAGSLNRLATMPASTIQLLGAEKALFKHIKFHAKPPKYGILYKLPQVQTAGKRFGGRIARVYATKICIAAKAEAYSKRFIADTLKDSLNKALARGSSRKDVPRPQHNDYRDRRHGRN